MFEAILVKPIFNLLVFISALVPGHNFGVAIILFTILARIIMWPLLKKQLHHAKAMRSLQPELKKIKKETKGDRQAESLATMALYKEREINPFASIGYLIIQLPIFIALYQVVRRLADGQEVAAATTNSQLISGSAYIKDGVETVRLTPEGTIVENSYSFIADLGWVKELADGVSTFDPSVLGFGDLTRNAIENSSVFWPAMIIVALSALVQYYSSKQLIATQGEKKSLRKLLRDQSEGKEVDQADMTAAIGQSTIYIIPGLIFFISLNLVSALPFYWLINGAIAFVQQKRVLDQDVVEMQAVVDDEEVTVEIEKPKKLNAKQKKEQRAKAAVGKKKTTTSKKKPRR